MNCGVCGGEVRGFRGTLYGRPIADWKHRTAPPGTAPHRPVLGTPVDAETLARIHRARDLDDSPANFRAPAPAIVERRPVDVAELASHRSLLGVLDEEGWTVLATEYRRRSDGVEYLMLRARRRDLGAVVWWKAGKFDSGWALTIRGIHQVGSTSLKEWIRQRDEECPDCGRSSVVHDEGECP